MSSRKPLDRRAVLRGAQFAYLANRLRAGGLIPGRHIRAPAKHPAAVVLAAMKAVGGGSTLGEISEPINKVFG